MKLTEQRIKEIIQEEIQMYNRGTLEEEEAMDFGALGKEAQEVAEDLGKQINDLILKKATDIAKAQGDETMAGAIQKVIQAAIAAEQQG